MIDIVILNVKYKNINDFIYKMYKNNIKLLRVKYINKNEINIYINKSDLDKILKYKIYDISIVKYIGKTRIKNILYKNRYMLISIFIGMFIFLILINIIYDIRIISSDNIKGLETSLKKHGIKKYSLAKNYDELNNIKNDILNEFNDLIEWLSIERVGTKYIIHVEKKKSYIKENDNKIYKIVAAKDALIRHIESSSGEVLGYVSKYVHKDEVLIDSDIKLYDNVKSIISAEGLVYGETWYKVNIEYPIDYYEEVYTGNSKDTFCLKLFSKNICLFNYKNKKISDEYILGNDIIPISLVKENQKEYEEKILKLSKEEALEHALIYARNKINTNLADDEFIIYEKRLKSEMKDSTIVLDVFYTVYENITKYVEKEELNDIQR